MQKFFWTPYTPINIVCGRERRGGLTGRYGGCAKFVAIREYLVCVRNATKSKLSRINIQINMLVYRIRNACSNAAID